MLEELDIRNVAVAEHVRLRFDPAFVALTGETGAGKSIVIDALGLLLGGRADPGSVRAGAERARIEGIFRLPEPPDPALVETLEEAGVEPEDGLLIISRDVPAQGRSVARVNGRAVVQASLVAIGRRLVDIHGQEDQLSILRPGEHLGYLDRYAGLGEGRAAVGALVGQLRAARAELDQITGDSRERTRRLERLRYELDEIAAADVQPDEEEALRAERTRLANAEELGRLAGLAYAALVEGADGPAAADALGVAADGAGQIARLDGRVEALAAQLEALQAQALDLARELRAYRDEVEADPERLAEIEARLNLLITLKRKYGPGLADVLAYAERAAAELGTLEGGEERAEALGEEIAALSARLGDAAAALSLARRAAAARLAAAVEAELDDLRLKGGRFAVRFECRPAPDGVPVLLPAEALIGPDPADPKPQHPTPNTHAVTFGAAGVDRVEFYVSLNPGEPLRPLARVASGGETARLMLALKTILGAADAVPTLVFDEVDVGIGGRSGQVVGEKLAALGAHHQVLCITHLPQVAAHAGQHFAVVKRLHEGRSATEIRELDRPARERELAEMLGELTDPNLLSARAMLDAAHAPAEPAPARRKATKQPRLV